MWCINKINTLEAYVHTYVEQQQQRNLTLFKLMVGGGVRWCVVGGSIKIEIEKKKINLVLRKLAASVFYNSCNLQ